MSIGLLGLIGFQLYWIDSVVRVNEENFKRDVIDALQNVSTKLEKQEAFFAFQNQFQQQAHTLQQLQSFDPFFQDAFSDEEHSHFEFYRDSLTGENRINFFFDFQIGNEQPVSKEDKKRLEKQKKTSEEQMAKLNRKSEMIFEILENMMLSNRTINSRFSPEQLDSLLKSELKEKGINIKYDYGVIAPMQSRFIHLPNLDTKDQLIASEFKTSLFPNDLIGDVNWLVVDFPEKEQFLLKKIWVTMASSGFLILIIAATFAYSIHTIMTQKKLSEMKNDFINNMTHELKTPISTISLAAEALNDKEIQQLPGMKERYLRMIAEENSRLGEQVERVLQMAALDKKDFNLKEEILDLHAIINSAMDKTMIQIENRGGHLNAILEASPSTIFADKTHMTNIVMNLLDNANKYSPESPHITLRTYTSNTQIFLSVQDHGVGISREAQKQIFQKFYRVPTGNVHNVKGFGLGLAYVHTMTEAQGGTISVSSELGRGSKFTITLPKYNG
jgi:two-component system, OmpR family, phosphate regulon sensor histidine kinase PhoR